MKDLTVNQGTPCFDAINTRKMKLLDYREPYTVEKFRI